MAALSPRARQALYAQQYRPDEGQQQTQGQNLDASQRSYNYAGQYGSNRANEHGYGQQRRDDDPQRQA